MVDVLVGEVAAPAAPVVVFLPAVGGDDEGQLACGARQRSSEHEECVLADFETVPLTAAHHDVAAAGPLRWDLEGRGHRPATPCGNDIVGNWMLTASQARDLMHLLEGGTIAPDFEPPRICRGRHVEFDGFTGCIAGSTRVTPDLESVGFFDPAVSREAFEPRLPLALSRAATGWDTAVAPTSLGHGVTITLHWSVGRRRASNAAGSSSSVTRWLSMGVGSSRPAAIISMTKAFSSVV